MPEFSAGDPAALDGFLDEDAYIAAAQKSYIECALWSGVHREPTEDDPNGEVNDATFDMLTGEAIEELCSHVATFCRDNVGLLVSHAILTGLDPINAASQIGNDFWLTRNHHGAGFWDRGLDALGKNLTAASHPYGECSLYLDDDGDIGVD